MGSIFPGLLFSMWIYTLAGLHNTFTERQTLHLRRITRVNQVGEMFANYNLIAAPPCFYTTAISKIYPKLRTLLH
jgi:maltose/moltooligosaccharide transporter